MERQDRLQLPLSQGLHDFDIMRKRRVVPLALRGLDTGPLDRKAVGVVPQLHTFPAFSHAHQSLWILFPST
jgi:hypothetical protein